MKDKILIISPRVPNPEANESDIRLLELVKILASKYEIHLMYSQIFSENENTAKQLSAAGVKLISLKSIFAKSRLGVKEEFENIVEKENYNIIFLDSCYSAKYYIPYLGLNNVQSIIVVNMDKSQFAGKMKLCKNGIGDTARAILLKEVETIKMKEIGICNYADVVIVSDTQVAKEISRDMPKVKICVIPDLYEEDSKFYKSESIIGVFSTIRKKEAENIYGTLIDVAVIKTDGNKNYDKSVAGILDSLSSAFKNIKIMPEEDSKEKSIVQRYNFALKSIKAEYGLILINESIITEQSLKTLLFCAKTHPEYGIIVPNSNLNINCQIMPSYLKGFEEKHFAANFGNWDALKQIYGYCFLIKREVIDHAGNIEEKYSSIRYALFDLCLKSYLAGYKTISSGESFVYYGKVKIELPKNEEKDYEVLVNKWCNLGAEFMNKQVN
jgi:hypothetical protein